MSYRNQEQYQSYDNDGNDSQSRTDYEPQYTRPSGRHYQPQEDQYDQSQGRRYGTGDQDEGDLNEYRREHGQQRHHGSQDYEQQQYGQERQHARPGRDDYTDQSYRPPHHSEAYGGNRYQQQTDSTQSSRPYENSSEQNNYDSDRPQNPYPPVAGYEQQPQRYSSDHQSRPQQHASQTHHAGTGPQKPSAYSNMPVHDNAPLEQQQYYSNMGGKRKGVFIGINYTGTSAALKGCHNDAENLSNFVIERYGYTSRNIKMLLDDDRTSRDLQPTRDNIIRAMQWLVEDAQPNDALFFHYSGHGSQQQSSGGDEHDGMAETICPLDYESAGQLTDDDMHKLLVAPLPKGCRLTAIMDCCHSGSSLDLPWMYDTSGKVKGPDHLDSLKDGAVSAFKAYSTRDIGGMLSSLALTGKKIFEGEQAEQVSKKTRSSEADVISWSGCRDDQTSSDTTENGEATGAMSHAFVNALTKASDQTYLQLLNTIRDELKVKGYDQKPQLSCSHELDCNLKAVF